MKAIVLGALVCALLVHPGAAQRAPEPSFARPLFTAAGLGALGWGLGALAGREIEASCTGSHCRGEAVLLGGAAGGGVGLALGANWGNRRRGSLPLDLITSAVVWGAGVALIAKFYRDENWTAGAATGIALPVAQLFATVVVERATGRARDRGREQRN